MLKNLITKINNSSLQKLIFFIIVFGFYLYARSLLNGFVWDDNFQIVQNDIIHNFSNLPAFFTGGTFTSGGAVGLSGNYYKPLMTILFSILYSLFSNDAFGFHFFDLFLHVLNTIIIFFLFKKVLSFSQSEITTFASFLASLIFLVHPGNVESVAFIASTQELLFTFFLLLSIFTLDSFSKGITVKKSFLLGLFTLFSLLSKESGIVTIPLTFIYSLYFLPKTKKAVIITESISFLSYIFIRFFVAQQFLFSSNYFELPIQAASPFQRVLTIPYQLASFLRIIFFPKDLYVYQDDVIKNTSDPRLYISLIIIITLSFIFVVSLIKIKSIIFKFFALWVAIGFFPLLAIFPLDMTIAERWIYEPMIGVLGILAFYLVFLEKKIKTINALFLFIILVIILFSVRTYIRIGDWQSNITLFSHDVSFEQNSPSLYDYYASILIMEKNYYKARKYYIASLKLSPLQSEAYSGLGIIAYITGDISKASYYFSIALNRNPGYITLEDYAQILYKIDKTKDKKDTLYFVLFALRSYPNNALLNSMAAQIYKETNQPQKAQEYIQKVPQNSNFQYIQIN